MSKQIPIALLFGTTAAFACLGVSFYADELGFSSLAAVLMWPNALLQSLVPPHNIGTPAHPLLEGSPLNDLAFFASIPFAAVAYGLLAFVLMRRSRRVP